MLVEVFNIYLSVLGLFFLVYCLQGSFMLLHIAEFPFFKVKEYSVVHIYHVFFIHSSVG